MSDEDYVLPPSLSAKYKSSFAYKTMKDRIPIIISKVVDSLSRNRDNILKRFGGENARDELLTAIGALSQLRYEVMTNKEAAPIRDSLPDVEAWNRQLKKLKGAGNPLTWYESSWLWMECYMYRRMVEAVAKQTLLKEFDVFEESKQSSFINSYQPMSTLTTYLKEVCDKVESNTDRSLDLGFYFAEFIQMALWGNKCDLSISAAQDNHQKDDPLEQLTRLKPKLLVDDTQQIFKALSEAKSTNGSAGVRVDIVMDNAGFELLTDWCLAEFLLTSGLASHVHFHVKTMPWFVSDVTPADFNWTMEQMCAMNHLAISNFGQKWKERVAEKSWIMEVDDFWCLPNDFAEMREVSPALYKNLSEADLVIFKGDLNYRKLTGDLKWETTTDFVKSLRGFLPSHLCALRTLKSDSVTGLLPGQAAVAEKENADWMTVGEWAVLSYASGQRG